MNMVNKEVNTDQDQLNESPLVFLSHDSRDSELAEAFSALIKNVSAGMLVTPQPSDNFTTGRGGNVPVIR